MNQPSRILLVDDDDSGRAMLGLSLRQAGFSVDATASAEEALRLLESEQYSWLITDAKMSPINGFELATQAIRLKPGLRILMISAVYEERDIYGYPIEKLLGKPVSLESLIKWLKGSPNSCVP